MNGIPFADLGHLGGIIKMLTYKDKNWDGLKRLCSDHIKSKPRPL